MKTKKWLSFSLIILFFPCICLAASLSKPITLAWDQNQEAFIAPEGQTQIPLAGWRLYEKPSEMASPTATVDVPYVPAQLSTTINADGTRTYTYGPMGISVTGTGGTTVQRCWHVTALGSNTTPPSETSPSNTACEDFVLPPDPIPIPGQPKNMRIQR